MWTHEIFCHSKMADFALILVVLMPYSSYNSLLHYYFVGNLKIELVKHQKKQKQSGNKYFLEHRIFFTQMSQKCDSKLEPCLM